MDGSAESLLAALRQFDESERVEAKRASEIGKSILETVCAFANEPGLGGGWLLLGVEKGSERPGDYQVVGIDAPDGLLNDLHTQCASVFNVPVRVQARAEAVEGSTVVVVDVLEAEPSAKPVYRTSKGLPGGAYRRSPNGDFRCNQDDLAIFYQNRSGRSFDAEPVMEATLDDIDPEALEEYRRAREAMNPAAEELGYDDEELLDALGGVSRRDGARVPTAAGILLFGRRAALRRLFPACRVDYIRVPGKEWIEDAENRFTTLDLRDTLPRLLQRASASVLDDIPRAFQLPEGDLRREEQPLLPAKVVREAIVNALMHRNYQRQQPIQIIRFSNRLEVRNPGYSLKPVEHLGEAGTEWRNPMIAQVLHEMGYAETKGSGVRVMRRLMEEAGLSPPSFDSDRHHDQFAATYLFHHFLTAEDVQWLGRFQAFGLEEHDARALIFVRETGRITNADYRDLNRVDTVEASQHLVRLSQQGLLEQVPRGPATYYIPGPEMQGSGGPGAESGGQASLPLGGDRASAASDSLSGESGRISGESDGLSGESSQISGESDTISGELGGIPANTREALLQELPEDLRERVDALGRRSRDTGRLVDVLAKICAVRAFTSRELGELTGRNPDYLQQSYLNPLVREGRLKYRFPDEPNRPDQAYIASGENE